MNTINTYIGNKPPKNSNTIWLRPLKQGGVGFYVWVNNKWNTIKLMDSKGSRTPMDDTPIDIDGDSDHYYTKDLIDDKFADILGLDASGIQSLIDIISDGDALSGILSEINKKVDSYITNDTLVSGGTVTANRGINTELSFTPTGGEPSTAANLWFDGRLRLQGNNNGGATLTSYEKDKFKIVNAGAQGNESYDLIRDKDLNETLNLDAPSSLVVDDTYSEVTTVDLPLIPFDNTALDITTVSTASSNPGTYIKVHDLLEESGEVQYLPKIDGVAYRYCLYQSSSTVYINTHMAGKLKLYFIKWTTGSTSHEREYVYKNGVEIFTVSTLGAYEIDMQAGDYISYTSSYSHYSEMFLALVRIDFTPVLAKVINTGSYNDLGDTPKSEEAASGGTALSMVTTGEKYEWDSKESTPTINDVLPSGTDKLVANTIYKPSSSVANKTFYFPLASSNSGKAIIIEFTTSGTSYSFSGDSTVKYIKGAVTSFESGKTYLISAISDGSQWLVSINKIESSLS